MIAKGSLRMVVMAGAAVAVAGASVADTLVLRSGKRVQGELVGVRGDTIEFEESKGLFSSSKRVVRYDREDVARIEFNESGSSGRGNDDEDEDTGRPRGLRERQVTVGADQPWTDAGIDVRSGQSVYFSATGRVNWGPGRKHGPAGESSSHHNPNRPMPSRPGAGLIGKVGSGSGDYFFIGDEEGAIRMRSSGRLHLGVNDDYLQDNSGSFRVTVYY